MNRLPTTTSDAEPGPPGRPALLVATGIFSSRVVGLIRQRAIAHYFGLETDAADAWAAGFRIPNFLQNLFGEGALSASFIPVYSSLLAQGRSREADRVAGAVGSILALTVSIVVAAGTFATPWLIEVIAPGFEGDKRQLTIDVVRILFPGAGLLVLSAWCLGVLNSHHKFLLSYAAPIVWSGAMIAALWWFGGEASLPALVKILAWSSVAGSALQVAVQVPQVLKVAPNLAPALDTASTDVRSVVRNFVPVLLSRGVVQISAYIDTLLASLLPTGAIAGLTNAQTLYTLPVSLFGMSVSAAELPAMARTLGADGSAHPALITRLNSSLRQIAFFVVPSAIAFLALGDVIAAALLQTGRFRAEDASYVWAILAGSAVGLLASTLGRLYASAFYALRDTRTPVRYALVRVTLTTVLGYVAAIVLPRWLDIDRSWGAAGLTASAGIAGWIEMRLLRRSLNRRVGVTGLPVDYLARLGAAAIAGALVAWAVKTRVPMLHPALIAVAVLGPYGVTFLALTLALKIPEATALTGRFRRRA